MAWTEAPKNFAITAKQKIRKHLIISIIVAGALAYIIFRKK